MRQTTCLIWAPLHSSSIRACAPVVYWHKVIDLSPTVLKTHLLKEFKSSTTKRIFYSVCKLKQKSANPNARDATHRTILVAALTAISPATPLKTVRIAQMITLPKVEAAVSPMLLGNSVRTTAHYCKMHASVRTILKLKILATSMRL